MTLSRRIDGGTLVSRLESKLPTPLEVGGGTAVLLEGRCFHTEREISRLEIVVGMRHIPVVAFGMPLPETVTPGDWWWAIVPFPRIEEAHTVSVRLCAYFAGGGQEASTLRKLDLVPGIEHPEPRAAEAVRQKEPLIAICMATHDPPPELFARQVESIRAQTYRNWVCVISDDFSSAESYRDLERVIGNDQRFVVSRSLHRSGFYHNFGRALALAPPEARYVALADQDDRWYPDKLVTLLEVLEPGSKLAYSDARVVSDDGQVISETYWRERRNNYRNFTSLLLANTITGAASLFSSELLRYVLPFPPPQGNIFHDHWIATVAMALGPISYVKRPLYDYVQHSSAALGHARANHSVARGGSLRAGVHVRRARRQRGWTPNWRSFYFGANCRVAIFSHVLEMRCGELMLPKRRRVVRRLSRIAESPPLVPWLALRSTRQWFGWNETARREQVLAKGLAWRFLARARLQALAAREKLGRRTGPPALPAPASPATAQLTVPSSEAGRPWLTPLLLDYFARDGSTLMMRLLGTSPQIAVERQYPFERKYFAYLWRWSRLLDRVEWPRESWGLAEFGSLEQEADAVMLGPPPWLPRELFNERSSGPISRSCFEAAWSEFSRRASGTLGAEGADGTRYYAEKHLNTWRVDLDELPETKVVVMLRDPRDTFVSMKSFAAKRDADFGHNRAGSEHEHLGNVITRQRTRMQWIAQLLNSGEVPVVRYEDLVLDIGGVAKRLGEALEVEFDAREAQADHELRKRHATAKSSDDSLGRWQTELSEQEIETFETALGSELRELRFES